MSLFLVVHGEVHSGSTSALMVSALGKQTFWADTVGGIKDIVRVTLVLTK